MPARNTSRGKRWCFTLNNWTEGEQQLLADLLDSEHVFYGVYGRETGENNTPHFQGYVIFAEPKTFNQAKQLLGERYHIEISKGTPRQASDYCKKDGDYEEFGELVDAKGKRTDWERLRDWCKEQNFMPTDYELWDTFPSLMGRYKNGVREMCHSLIRIDPRETGQLRNWQRDLERWLDGEPDDRRVTFVVDEEGNTGKSWFIRYYQKKYPKMSQKLPFGKRDDMAHAVESGKRVYFIDVPRQSMEYLQYSILEMLKDKSVSSPKYESVVKEWDENSHVVVFCNEEPDREKLTRDRYHIFYPHDIDYHLNRAIEREGDQDQ